MGRIVRVVLPGAITGFVLAGLMAGLAAAESPGRAEYVAGLEAVCKPRAEATRRAMSGARDDVQAGRLAVASRKFGRAAEIFGGTVRTIARAPRPESDRDRLREWFGYLKRQESYLKDISAQLRAGRTIKAQRLMSRFIHNGNLANNATLPFGFDYCNFKFSRYG